MTSWKQSCRQSRRGLRPHPRTHAVETKGEKSKGERFFFWPAWGRNVKKTLSKIVQTSSSITRIQINPHWDESITVRDDNRPKQLVLSPEFRTTSIAWPESHVHCNRYEESSFPPHGCFCSQRKSPTYENSQLFRSSSFNVSRWGNGRQSELIEEFSLVLHQSLSIFCLFKLFK